jgi:hypothetical protein
MTRMNQTYKSRKKKKNQLSWHKCITPALRKLKQENHKFKAHSEILSEKQKQNREKKSILDKEYSTGKGLKS